jgi:nitrite reductase/ring-hydroxylating ferredoxin subunit/plasmid stabilization system protein ParE
VSERQVRRFVSDLLRGRRPGRFQVEEHEAAELRAAITLRAARPGAGAPREEFLTDLHNRLAAHVAGPGADPPDGGSPDADLPGNPRLVSRRRLVATTGIAAGAAAVVGAGADRLLDAPAEGTVEAAPTLEPNVGQWRTVAASAELPEGGAAGFDLGSVAGFVARQGGEVAAVSAMCTHLGCRLALNAPARRLDCPCHQTSFALGGQLLTHQLPAAPAPLPRFRVREQDGSVQVFAPPEA